MSTPLLTVDHLLKRYGEQTVVRDLSFHIEPGECLGVIGPNGAGKTTFFNLLTGMYVPEEGKILHKGVDVTRMTPQERVAMARQTNSILDMILDRTKKLQGELGGEDRQILDAYLTNVREIERRAKMASNSNLSAIKIPNAPVGELENFAEQVKIMYDLLALAYQADLTRVATYVTVAEGTNRSYPFLDVTDGFHPVSHHGDLPEQIGRAHV